MQTLAYKKPYSIPVDNECVTVPYYRVFSTSVTMVLAANKIRYQLSGITEADFNLLNDSLYLFIQDQATSQSGEARAITSLEKVEGTPDTFFAIIDTPFIAGSGTYIVRYVDPQDWEPSISVEVTVGTIALPGGGNQTVAGNIRTFLASKPQAPIVIELAVTPAAFSISNTISNSITI